MELRVDLRLIFVTGLLVNACDCGGGDAPDRVNAKLTIEPGAIDFGNTRVGSRTMRTVKISNTGLVDVALEQIAIRDFTSFQIEDNIVDAQKILEPGEEETIEVSFVP